MVEMDKLNMIPERGYTKTQPYALGMLYKILSKNNKKKGNAKCKKINIDK